MMTYKEFMDNVSKENHMNSGAYVIKDGRRKSDSTNGDATNDLELKNILKDIKIPAFYGDVAELEGVELI